jgi:hypothetical protein
VILTAYFNNESESREIRERSHEDARGGHWFALKGEKTVARIPLAGEGYSETAI